MQLPSRGSWKKSGGVGGCVFPYFVPNADIYVLSSVACRFCWRWMYGSKKVGWQFVALSCLVLLNGFVLRTMPVKCIYHVPA